MSTETAARSSWSPAPPRPRARTSNGCCWLRARCVTPAGRCRCRSASTAAHLFAGGVGPPYRRTYTVMGDTVNLAARVMARAAPGEVLAAAAVLDAADIEFASSPVEPFMAKGKRARWRRRWCAVRWAANAPPRRSCRWWGASARRPRCATRSPVCARAMAG